MREFLRTHLMLLLAFMSGIVSVMSWLIAAIMEYKDYSVPARVSFYFGGIASSILASFFIWKRANDTANQRIATANQSLTERDSEIAKLRSQLADKTSELAEKDAARIKEQSDSEKKALAHARLNKLRHDLITLVETRKTSYPRSGGNYELARMETEHAQETRGMLERLLTEARKEASVASLDNFLPTETDLDVIAPNHLGMLRFAKLLDEGFGVILNRLG